MLVSEIIENVRYRLGDTDNNRWSDNRLIGLLSRGQTDLVNKTSAVNKQIAIAIKDGKSIYDLPDTLTLVSRVESEDGALDIVGRRDLDSRSKTWFKSGSDKLESIIYDKNGLNELKIYPIPQGIEGTNKYEFPHNSYNQINLTDSIDFDEDFGLLSGGDEDFGLVEEYDGYESEEDFGIVEDLEEVIDNSDGVSGSYGLVTSMTGYGFNSSYGLATSISSDENQVGANFNSSYGLVTEILEPKSLIVYYTKTPDKLTSLTDELEVEDIWESALIYYVSSQALLDDFDPNNRQLSIDMLTLYKEELNLLYKNSARGNMTRPINRFSSYRSAF